MRVFHTRLTLRMLLLVSLVLLLSHLLVYYGLAWTLLRRVDRQLAARIQDGAIQLQGGAPSLGDPVATFWMDAGGLRPPDAPIAVAAIPQHGPRRAVQSVRGPDGRWFRVLVAAPEHGTERRASLVAIASLDERAAVLRTTRNVLIGSAALLGIVSVVATRVISRSTVAPLATLVHEASDLILAGHGQQSQRLAKTSVEIAPLAGVINSLIDLVEETIEHQRQFLANTSHELRSPLTVILANLNFLQRDLSPHERTISLNESIVEAQRMRRLVNDLLLLARTDAAQMVERVPVRLDRLVATSVATLLRQVATHPITWSAPQAVTVLGDEERLTQLLRNLLENGVQHTPPGTTIHLAVQRGERFAKLIVEDSGPGIPAQHLAYIWDRFYQVNRARPRSSGGTGLGLPIVKYIAEAHGGSVRLDTSVGSGTKFTITLPYVPEDAYAPAADPSHAAAPPP